MPETTAGYRELEHTADWQLEVWAPDYLALLEQAARGMYALSGTRLAEGPRQAITLDLTAGDAEGLLVKFLAELLWLGQHDHLGYDAFNLQVYSDTALVARLEGAPIIAQSKEIKAVTYHNLAIRQTGRGLEVSIVFDV